MLRLTIEERKNYLAEVASKVFAQKGFSNASLQDVASEAGISKSGIYHYFASKDDILYYLLFSRQGDLLQQVKDCVDRAEKNNLGPEDAFRELVYTYASFINSEKELRLIVLHDRHQLTGESEANLKRLEQEIYHAIKGQIKKLLSFNNKFDPSVVSFMIIAMSHWIGSWLNEDGKLSQDDVIKQGAEIILRGIFTGNKS